MLKKLDIGTSEIEQVEAFNALVDVVNELQKKFGEIKIKTEIVEECLHPTAKVDPYAEQRKALDKGMEHITGLNNMIESWYKLINSDLDQETKLRILKSAISAYVENKGGNNE